MESTNKHTLLIVEDNAINREMLGDILEADYDLFYAENGKVGLDILKKDPSAVSLVLLDLHMPVMGGLEMLFTTKKNVWSMAHWTLSPNHMIRLSFACA